LSYEARQSGLDAGIEMMTEKIDILQANNPEYKTLIGMYTTDKLWFEYLKETDDQTRNRREWEQTEKAAIEAKGGKVFDRPDCGY
jgi:hydroxymethylpyrimidine/phosphomethylpyrimidine kinase